MTKQEFETLAGYEVSFSDYYDIIEPLYMSTDATKAVFVQMLNPKRFALPTKAETLKAIKAQAKTAAAADPYTFFDEWQKLESMVNDFAIRFYHVDRCTTSEWCFISEDGQNPHNGRPSAISAHLGRLHSLNIVISLYNEKPTA